jgi:prolyl-tRNA editing enzyme YbaK/EbsC (Cys-tRNA(Pro) deacylase)
MPSDPAPGDAVGDGVGNAVGDGAGPDPEALTRAVVERLGVPFEMLTCEPEFADTAAFCARYGYPLETAANTLIVASKKEPRRYAACVVLATTRLDVNRAVRDLLGVQKCSFATSEEMQALTGMTVGGVTVFGLPPDLPLYVDERVMALSWVILGSGGRNGKVKISPQVFGRMPGARVVAGLAVEPKT